MFRGLSVVLLLALYAAPVSAQTGAPTSYIFRIYQSGSNTVIGGLLSVPAANIPCDLAPETGSNINPVRWRFVDPARPTRECEFPDAARLTALSDGNYEGTAAAANADGTSAETARVPFVRRRPNPPSVPTGLKVIQ